MSHPVESSPRIMTSHYVYRTSKTLFVTELFGKWNNTNSTEQVSSGGKRILKMSVSNPTRDHNCLDSLEFEVFMAVAMIFLSS
jgi:hypothetical protein